MLHPIDYRAALLQVYRAYRWNASGGAPFYSQAQAYSLAKGMVKPLPDDRETAQLCIAFREYVYMMSRCEPEERRPRAQWLMCWAYARNYLNQG